MESMAPLALDVQTWAHAPYGGLAGMLMFGNKYAPPAPLAASVDAWLMVVMSGKGIATMRPGEF